MENAVKLSVPMLVDGKIITNWAEMKDDDTPSFPLRFDYFTLRYAVMIYEDEETLRGGGLRRRIFRRWY